MNFITGLIITLFGFLSIICIIVIFILLISLYNDKEDEDE